MRFAPELDALTSAPRAQRSHAVRDALRERGMLPPGRWDALDDDAFASAIARGARLTAGLTLSECAAEQAAGARWVPLPLTRQPIELHAIEEEADGDRRSRHVARWLEDPDRLPAHAFVVAGLESAEVSPGVLDAIREADVVVLPPMSPLLDAAAFLAAGGVREALQGTNATVVALSPCGLDEGRPADALASVEPLTGGRLDAAGVAGLYADFLDALVVDDDEPSASYPRALRVRRAPLRAALSGDEAAVEGLRRAVLD